ncbi:MAG: hypothetical protein AAFY98_09360 [Verrucomicrobiota bacterium]
MKKFEQNVVEILLNEAGLDELLDIITEKNNSEVYDYTGHGYFLEIQNDSLPVKRIVLDKPYISGHADGIDDTGFLAFIEHNSFTLECHGCAEGIPENYRELDIDIKYADKS